VGPWVVAVALVIVVLLLIAAASKRSPRDGEPTAGHYDPDAIGSYTYNPATTTYSFELPTLPRTSAPGAPGSGLPHRCRRRRSGRPTDAEGG